MRASERDSTRRLDRNSARLSATRPSEARDTGGQRRITRSPSRESTPTGLPTITRLPVYPDHFQWKISASSDLIQGFWRYTSVVTRCTSDLPGVYFLDLLISDQVNPSPPLDNHQMPQVKRSICMWSTDRRFILKNFVRTLLFPLFCSVLNGRA